jgi:hypothetical protein
VVERVIGRSAFTWVGAESELLFRNDGARCQGAFRHAILLGSVAAAFLSLYIGLWVGAGRRSLATIGAAACVALVILSNSGGPVTSVGAALVGWSTWFLRDRMFLVRRGVLGLLVLTAVVMKAPIWYLPYKISGIVGGGGYHRGLLMDQAWQDLGKWWLAGMNIRDTASWIPYVHDLFGGADVTNQFLTFGLRAGAPAIALFILLLAFGLERIGHAQALLRAPRTSGSANEFLLWGLGVALFVHAVSWWGVAYFDQSYVVWLAHMAAASASVAAVMAGAPEAVGLRAPAQLVPATRGRKGWALRKPLRVRWTNDRRVIRKPPSSLPDPGPSR